MNNQDILTPELNTSNINFIQQQIKKKNSSIYFANNKTIQNVVTDYDHDPYTRWFRGVYYYPEPIVAEREAGYRPIENSCYSVIPPPSTNVEYLGCFEHACSTIFPCLASEQKDQEEMNRNINARCLVKYR